MRLEDMIPRRVRASLGAMKELALLHARRVPFPAVAPELGRAGVFIGASNSAGQGWAWGRALERSCPELQAVSARFGGEDEAAGFSFEVDQQIYSHYAAHSAVWQRRQFAALSGYRAALIESGDEILSRLFDGDTAAQAKALQSAGVEVALLFHGSDIRSPDQHIRLEPLSHFGVDPEFTGVFRELTARNRELVDALQVPVFVSTPDLLDEVSGATWLPVVVEPERWVQERRPLDGDGPMRVAHVPSSSMIKGTELVEPLLLRLAAEGAVDYRPVREIAHSEMPAAYLAADVVVDQFRVGNYGVAACEAMASGRIVVSHVSARVRSLTRELTGEDLPIVEATPETLRDVLEDIRERPAVYRRIAADGPGFVRRHHDGTRSAAVLVDWLRMSSS